MEIDIDELEIQRREQIIKNGKYAKLEIIVSQDDVENPSCSVHMKGINGKPVASLILTVRKTLEALEKEFPEAAIYSKLFMSSNTKIFRSGK